MKMKNQKNVLYTAYLLLLLLALFLIQSCVVYTVAPVKVPDIVQMSKDKVPAEDIIRDIRRSRTVYWLKFDQLAKLRDKGVSDTVINYMEKTHMDAVARDQRLMYGSYWYPYDSYFYGGLAFGWPFGYWGYNWWGPGIIFGNRGFSYGGYRGGGGFHGGGSIRR
jgi:hypothetical protein